MMAGPGEERAAAVDRGRLRASHADREHALDTLKDAFVQGRLSKDELDLRAGQALASRTYADLAALTADLPVVLPGAQPPGETVAAGAQQPVNKALMWGSWAVILLVIGYMVGAFPADNLEVLGIGVLPLLIAAPIAGTLTIDTWRERRSRGQLPPGPAGASGIRVGER
jgi:hypothetical protein